METDTVVNLLKKLHKELQADSVLKFIKCWLGDPEALNDPDSCVLSRPDAKGRMRRIDGGKGSDKVCVLTSYYFFLIKNGLLIDIRKLLYRKEPLATGRVWRIFSIEVLVMDYLILL